MKTYHNKRFNDDDNGTNGSKEERTLAATMVLKMLEKSHGAIINDMNGLSKSLIRLAYATTDVKKMPKGRIEMRQPHLLMRVKRPEIIPIPTLNIEVYKLVCFSA